MKDKVTVCAPATVANVCCGFDLLGFAVKAPVDEVTVQFQDGPGVRVEKITGDDGRLPLDAEKNTAGVGLIAMMNALNETRGLSLTLKKNLPLGSGMGSSAASAAAALIAANKLLGSPLQLHELVKFGMEAERIACGAAHADNIAPAILGGFVLIRDYATYDFVKIKSAIPLHCTLVHPRLEVRTADSRKVLKRTIALKESLVQSGNLAGLVTGLLRGDAELISRSLVDVIAEPARSVFIPGFDKMRAAVKQQGALGFGISGSGPTVFTLSLDGSTAALSGEIIQTLFKEQGLSSDVYLSEVNEGGAMVV